MNGLLWEGWGGVVGPLISSQTGEVSIEEALLVVLLVADAIVLVLMVSEAIRGLSERYRSAIGGLSEAALAAKHAARKGVLWHV